MKDGDLTEKEADQEEAASKLIQEEKKVAEGKIAFKKPTKRDNEDNEDSKNSDEPKKKKGKVSSKSVKQKKSLLSFDEDEEEDS